MNTQGTEKKKCLHCGKEFTVNEKQGIKMYCSDECRRAKYHPELSKKIMGIEYTHRGRYPNTSATEERHEGIELMQDGMSYRYPETDENWEKEFDSLPTFTKHIGTAALGEVYEKYVLVDKQFIRNLLSHQDKTLREMIEKAKLIQKKGAMDIDRYHYVDGYNAALSQVLYFLAALSDME